MTQKPLVRWIALATVTAFFVPTPPVRAALFQAAGQLDWAVVDPTCTAAPPNVLVVPCGAYGKVLFGTKSTPSGCSLLAWGRERPKAYPRPGEIESVIVMPALTGAKGDPPSFVNGELPCDGGSCFSPPGGPSGAEPWIALADWNDWHGWTTGWMTASVGDVAVHLFALDNLAWTAKLGPGTSDGHVLATLCGVAQSLENPAIVPPLALNMSFGRLPGTLEVIDPATCSSNDVNVASSLGCQVQRVLEHLGDAGVALIASAGNHQEMLFPAAAQGVLAAGSLDLAKFRWTEEVQPAWESPTTSEALLPGYGVCLDFSTPTDPSALWPAPPGSSYASAMLAGWLADSLQRPDPVDLFAGSWHPVWSPTAGCYQLSRALDEPCNPVANALLDRMLGNDSEACWVATTQEPNLRVSVGATSASLAPVISLDQWVRNGHNPAPEADYCVPCVTTGGGSLTAISGDLSGELVLDLSASGTEGGASMVLQALQLHFGTEFYLLPLPSYALDQIADGQVESLILEGLPTTETSRSIQPSLVYVFCVPNDASKCFWTSTPILLSAPGQRGVSSLGEGKSAR